MEFLHRKPKQIREPGFGLSLVVLLIVAFAIVYSVAILELSPQLPIIFGAIFTAFIGYFVLGCPWEVIDKGIRSSISEALISLLILLMIGALIGIWITTGVVPGLIYYGLPLLSPSIFLTATLLISSIVALATGSSWSTTGTVGIALIGMAVGGSSWSTTGTVGIALIGMAVGLGIPTPVAAGFIISGAYFGDKMSPLSETTNLAPAKQCYGVQFQHISSLSE